MEKEVRVDLPFRRGLSDEAFVALTDPSVNEGQMRISSGGREHTSDVPVPFLREMRSFREALALMFE